MAHLAPASISPTALRRSPGTSCPAFLAPFVSPSSQSVLPCRPVSRCPRRRHLLVMKLENPSGSTPTNSAQIHHSWRVYSRPGNLCVVCGGKGETRCLYCYGEGTVRIGPETGRDTLDCPHCAGAGVEICIRCEGSGKRPTTRYDTETKQIVANITNQQVNQMDLPSDPNQDEPVPADPEPAANGLPL